MHTFQIAGAICLDVIPELPGPAVLTPGALAEAGPLTARPGGPVANTGGALRDLGASVRLSAHLGADPLGQLLRRLMVEQFGAGDGLTTMPGTDTSYSVVVQPPGADRTYWHHVGANATFDGDDVDPDLADVLHVGYPSFLPALAADGGRPLARLFALARSRGTTTSLDLSYIDPASSCAAVDWPDLFRRVLIDVDILSPSIVDLTSALRRPPRGTLEDAAEMAHWLLGHGPGLVMVTAGAEGLVVVTGDARRLRRSAVLAPLAGAWAGQELKLPATAVTVRDTSCAGDAATAGLLFGLAVGLDLPEAARLAVTTAARRVSGARRLRPYGAAAPHDVARSG